MSNWFDDTDRVMREHAGQLVNVKIPSAEQIKEYRKNSGIAQKTLASIAGVSRRTWSRWESGESRPTKVMWTRFLNNRGVVSDEDFLKVLKHWKTVGRW